MKKTYEIGKVILKEIFSNGFTTRPEIVNLTGTRAATVFYAIDQLKNKGIIYEPNRAGKKSGRKAPELHFKPDYMYLIGIDFQVSKTIAVLTDMEGKILGEAETLAENRETLLSCQKEIITTLKHLKKEAGASWKKVQGIGFADPGLVDIQKKYSNYAVNVPAWKNVATGEWLTTEFGFASGVWPECMVKTFVEYQSRHFPQNLSLFHLSLGNEIGGGFIKDGNCFIGDSNQAMEVGHIVLDPNGPICHCGNRGCLEAVAGEAEIRHRVQELLEKGVSTGLSMEEFSPAKLAEYAGFDKAARIIATDICEKIGKALSIVVTLLNPSIIVLSGNLTGMGELLTSSIRNILELNCFPAAVKKLKLEISSAKPEDTARGAALMMCGKLLNLN